MQADQQDRAHIGARVYRLHGVHDWGSIAVHMALEEIGASFEFVPLNPARGDLAGPAFRATNPFGLIPVLETPQGPMFETTAILLYLADRHGMLAPAPDAADRGAFLVWLAAVCQQLHPLVLHLIHPERFLGDTVQRAVAEACHSRLITLVNHLDTQAARGDWWLSGARPSILSLYVAMLLLWAQALPPYADLRRRLADFPALLALAQSLEQHPAIACTLLREGLCDAVPRPLSAPPYEGAQTS